MTELSGVSVVLPSLDPDEKLLTVINGLIEHGFDDIILVNDGSKPENLHYFETAAQNPQVHLLHHPVNRGKGAALKTAFTWFLENRPDRLGVVTVDGDNQHHPKDTRLCSLHMLETGHLTLGVRDFSQPDVPFRSRNGNRITSFVFKVFVGMNISDTQTGLRAIPRKDVELLLGIAGDRFEYETNMLLAMKEHAIPFDEVKIRTVYIEENKSSHFRAVRDSWRIYKLILAHFFRYTASSLVCAVVDEFLFLVLDSILPGLVLPLGLISTVVCTAGARTVSSLLNFFLNKKLVFHSNMSTGKALLRYYSLAIPMLFAQAGLTHLLKVVFSVSSPFAMGVIYAVVMVLLYIVSFYVQQRWVFDKKRENEYTEVTKNEK